MNTNFPSINHEIFADDVNRRRILESAQRMLRQNCSTSDVEEVCLGVNKNLNYPPLQPYQVREIIESLISKSAREKVIADLGFDISLGDGIISYSVSTPARPFLFGNDVIPLGTLSVIGGLGGSGKSMAMVEMIGAAAIGGAYANRE